MCVSGKMAREVERSTLYGNSGDIKEKRKLFFIIFFLQHRLKKANFMQSANYQQNQRKGGQHNNLRKPQPLRFQLQHLEKTKHQKYQMRTKVLS